METKVPLSPRINRCPIRKTLGQGSSLLREGRVVYPFFRRRNRVHQEPEDAPGRSHYDRVLFEDETEARPSLVGA
jgi:hypothetical protein